MEVSHLEENSSPQIQSAEDLSIGSRKRKHIDEENAVDNEQGVKSARVDKTTSQSLADNPVELSRLCDNCSKVGNELYDKRLDKRIRVPILNYPKDRECALCTMLHDEIATLKRCHE